MSNASSYTASYKVVCFESYSLAASSPSKTSRMTWISIPPVFDSVTALEVALFWNFWPICHGVLETFVVVD